MEYLVAFHWIWIVVAAVIGLGMGWIAVVQRATGLSRRGVYAAAVVLLAAIALSASRVVPGRAGYWLDLGLTMLVVYLAGCAVGSWLRARVIRRSAPPV